MPILRAVVSALALVLTGFRAMVGLEERVVVQRASMHVQHIRNGKVLHEQTVKNLKTNAGIDFLHLQGYGSSGLGANGLNFIALSNDAVTENAASTTLSNEIAANGLSRAAGVVAHTVGTTTTTIAKTFTCTTTSQAAQKAALFSASSSGTMCHVLAFTQRTLQVGDQLVCTFTITLS